MASARIPALLSALVGLGLTASIYAQGAAPAAAPAVKTAAPPDTEKPAILAPTASAETKSAAEPRRNRAISPEVAAQLRANTPKFSPAPPKPEPKPESQVDLREVDKPRNGIIRLDPVYVREPREAVLSERAVNTPAGLADIAMRRYISEFDRALNRITLPLVGSSAVDRALAMYSEDERLQNMASLKDSANATAKSDPAAGEYVRRQTQQTFMRTSDFGWSSSNSKTWQSEAGAAVRAAGNQPGQRQ